jgi:hypothetical protein
VKASEGFSYPLEAFLFSFNIVCFYIFAFCLPFPDFPE